MLELEMEQTATDFTVNASRVPMQGGLRAFTQELMLAALANGYRFRAVVPAGLPVPPNVEAIHTPASLAGGTNLSRLRPLKWLAYSRFRFPEAKGQRILCTTHHVLPGRRRQIVTIHDLRPYYFPDTAVQGFYFKHMLKRSLQHCDGVLTVSETSRNLIAETYRFPLDRIAVVPNVIRPSYTGGSQPDPVGQPYLLAVGVSWPHKNIESLLRSHKTWAAQYVLVVVAGPGQYRDELQRIADAAGIAHKVRFLSNVAGEQLNALYAHCAALVAPSRMEGFGLPPLEAMAQMRPAIVANIPVFRELYGPHAIFVDTEEESSWATAFDRLTHVDSRALAAAQTHALSFTQERMNAALGHALKALWGL